MAPKERKRPTRSAAYQHLLVEKAMNHEMMGSFSVDDGMYKKLNPFDYDERILELEDRLKERFWEIINDNLTERQLEIVNLLKEGKTQMETAKILSINQCLSGDTEVSFIGGNMSIIDLWEQWTIHPSMITDLEIRCVDEETKKMTTSKVVAVVKNEPKQLIRLTTESGKSIRTSEDHKFFTDRGWMRLNQVIEFGPGVMVLSADGEKAVVESIVSWEEDVIEDTFDLEVGGPWHNFVANNLLISNSSITKSIHGNTSYDTSSKNKDGSKTSYGGVVKKVLKIAAEDPEIKLIKEKISNIRNNSWD